MRSLFVDLKCTVTDLFNSIQYNHKVEFYCPTLLPKGI